MRHPLLEVMLEAAAGRPPVADCSVDLLPSPPGPANAVVSFTAHSYVSAPVDPERLRSRLRPGDPGAATRPEFLAWLAAELDSGAGQLDMLLAAFPLDGPPPLELVPRDDLVAHPRVARAHRYRGGDLRVLGDPEDGVVLVLGRGLAGRMEIAFEVHPHRRGRGLGRAAAIAARHMAPRDEPLFAQVSPGNVASVHALLAAGYSPVASEVLYPRNLVEARGDAGQPGMPAR
jgi:RimJ/RimL family protein N-acetyltransferase